MLGNARTGPVLSFPTALAARGLRRALAELLAVLDREAAHMGESIGRRDARNLLLRRGPAQRLMHLLEPRLAQVMHRRCAPEIPKMLEQGTARDTGGGDNLMQTNRFVQVCLDVIDWPLDIARRERFFTAA